MRIGRTSGLVAMALFALALSPVHGQTSLPSVEPSACKIEQIAIPVQGEEGDLSTPAPSPTPIVQAGAVPADGATVSGVTETIAQSIACQNAGDRLRMLATFSDRWVAQLFSGYDLVFYDEFVAQVSIPATPVADDAQVALVDITDVQLREDGAVIATVTTTINGDEHVSRLLLVQVGGDWKIDGAEIVS